MLKKEFILLVISEIENIKLNATIKEKSKLNISSFNYDNDFRCLYGQMTGSCDSKRAKELTPKIFFDAAGNKSSNNREKVIPFSNHNFKKGNFYTPLEKYLFMVKSNVHENIINYLKGTVNELILK